MSTHNLARTVIEGGRSGSYKTEVAISASTERSRTRDYLRAATLDPESYEEKIDPRRNPTRFDVRDKLNPMYRFMDANLGRSWGKVRSELFTKFDCRVMPGRHLLFDHVLKDVAEGGEDPQLLSYKRYYLDNQGRLCKRERKRSRGAPPDRDLDTKKLCAWLGNRKVSSQGNRFVWHVPVDPKACLKVKVIWEKGWNCRPVYVYTDAAGNVQYTTVTYPTYYGRREPEKIACIARERYRPVGLLEGKDEAYFKNLPEKVQLAILQVSK